MAQLGLIELDIGLVYQQFCISAYTPYHCCIQEVVRFNNGEHCKTTWYPGEVVLSGGAIVFNRPRKLLRVLSKIVDDVSNKV